MWSVLLPPGVNPIAVTKYISYHNEDTIDSQIRTGQGYYLNMLLITGDEILI